MTTDSLTIYASGVQAATLSRSLVGDVVRFGVPGRTSVGLLKVRPGALRFPAELSRVKLTKEHDRDQSRGHLSSVMASDTGLGVVCRVADGPEGDAALQEAKDKTRDGFSFDVIDALIQGDELVDAEVIAIGQVGIPAYSDSRITQVAASQQKEGTMTNTPTTQPEPEKQPEPEPQPQPEPQPEPDAPAQPTPEKQPEPEGRTAVAASVPAGVPAPQSAPARTAPRGDSPLQTFIGLVTAALQPQRAPSITAALSNITNTDFIADVGVDSWSGELWSGLQYSPQFQDLFNSGPLTSWTGKGWRWTTKPEVADYPGDKTEIPSNAVATEPTSYEAFRIAGGWDIDRKFFDFPDSGFIASFLAAVRESYAKKMDFKVRDYVVANAVTPAGVTNQTSLLRAARLAVKHVKRNTDGAAASFILMNDDDIDTLFDITSQDVSAFLGLLGVRPEDFRDSPDIAAGFVYAGARQAATVRQLPGASPLRVEAQHLTHGGIDQAFFGYGAIEEHHPAGIVKIPFDTTP